MVEVIHRTPPLRLVTVFAEDWSQIEFPGNKLWDHLWLKETAGERKNLNQKEVTTKSDRFSGEV